MSFSTRVRRTVESLSQLLFKEQSPSTKKLVRISIFFWLLLGTVILLPEGGKFWSPQSYIPVAPFNSSEWSDWYARLILHPMIQEYYWVFVSGQILSCLFGIFSRYPRIAAVFVHFFTTNLWARQWVTLDGGNNLMELMMIYLFFVESTGVVRSATSTPMSNLAFLMMRLQVIFVYFTAGWAKLNGELWRSGMALYYILQVDQYSHPTLGRFLVTNPTLATLGTYFTVGFQVSFPFLVWGARTRPIMLLLGTLLHSQIMFVMGLPMFGLAMIVSYAVFFRESWSMTIFSWLSRSRPIHVAFDHSCSMCMRFAGVIRFLDHRSMLQTDNASNPYHPALAAVPANHRLERMWVFDEATNRLYSGWDGLTRLFTIAPILSLLWPLMAAIGISGLGERLYRIISLKEGRRRCGESCAVPGGTDA